MKLVAPLREWAAILRRQTLVVYYAARDPRTPWVVRLLALAVAAYALSPIDLIPDFIPVLGLLDDLIMVPLGVALVLHLTPEAVLVDARARAARTMQLRNRVVAAVIVIVAVWVLAAAVVGWWAWKAWHG